MEQLQDTKANEKYTGASLRLAFAVFAIAALGTLFIVMHPVTSSFVKPVAVEGVNIAPVVSGNPRTVYVQDGDHITVLDIRTRQVVHTIPLGLAGTNISLVADAYHNRLLVADTAWEKDRAVDYVTVYRTNNWSMEYRVPVQNIIRYNGNLASGIAPSSDGRYLYVYNNNDRTRRGTEPVRYWLTVFDLSMGAWLPQEIDLPSCGVSQFFPIKVSMLYVVCYDTNDIRVVDVARSSVGQAGHVVPAQLRSGWSLTDISAATLLGETIYLVTDNREIHVKNPNAPQADRVLTTPASTEQPLAPGRFVPQKIVPIQPIGIESNGRYLFVPTSTSEERSHGIASEIAVIDTNSGKVVRTLRPQPFSWVTFAPDGSSAFIVVIGKDGYGEKLVWLDLQSGTETELLSGAISPGLIVVP